MDGDGIDLLRGMPERHRRDAALLYDEAFGAKLSLAVRSDENRLSLLEDCIVPAYAMAAVSQGDLVGIAGFCTAEGSFTRGLLSGGAAVRALMVRLGVLKGGWAAFVLSLYERKPEPGELLMDGIAVRSDYRGQGIGSRLLEEIAGHAARTGCRHVRLDVIDTNPRAKRLYERKGFEAVKTEEYPYLRWLLGFGASTTMVRTVAPGGSDVT